ncbi:MAG: REP-associated tyrosine transposase [Acidobacteriota bacterium]|nr:REP-associated tyrosine transposase [Acidobacteriota bacterium]
MKFNPEKHHRHSIRLTGYDYSRAGTYFVTICTQDRECFFGDVIENQMILNQNGIITRNCWFGLLKIFNNIQLPDVVIMPNHIHGIIIIQYQVKNHRSCRGLIHQTPDIDSIENPEWILMRIPSLTLGKVIRHFKAHATINIRKNGAGHFQWQRNYYEEIIRNNKEMDYKRSYITNNPLEWEEDEANPKNIRKEEGLIL